MLQDDRLNGRHFPGTEHSVFDKIGSNIETSSSNPKCLRFKAQIFSPPLPRD